MGQLLGRALLVEKPLRLVVVGQLVLGRWLARLKQVPPEFRLMVGVLVLERLVVLMRRFQ